MVVVVVWGWEWWWCGGGEAKQCDASAKCMSTSTMGGALCQHDGAMGSWGGAGKKALCMWACGGRERVPRTVSNE